MNVFFLGWLVLAVVTFGYVGWVLRALPGRSFEEQTFYGYVLAVTLVAMITYLLLSLGYGSVVVGEKTIHVPFYLNWMITTPLIVISLTRLARSQAWMKFALIVLSLMMVICGVVSVAWVNEWRYAFWAISSVGLLVVILILREELRSAEFTLPREMHGIFRYLVRITSVLWAVYPVLWLLGPNALGIIPDSLNVGLSIALDVVAKLVLSFFIVHTYERIKAGMEHYFANVPHEWFWQT